VCVCVCERESEKEAEWADVDNMLMILLLHFLPHSLSQHTLSVWAHTHTHSQSLLKPELWYITAFIRLFL